MKFKSGALVFLILLVGVVVISESVSAFYFFEDFDGSLEDFESEVNISETNEGVFSYEISEGSLFVEGSGTSRIDFYQEGIINFFAEIDFSDYTRTSSDFGVSVYASYPGEEFQLVKGPSGNCGSGEYISVSKNQETKKCYSYSGDSGNLKIVSKDLGPGKGAEISFYINNELIYSSSVSEPAFRGDGADVGFSVGVGKGSSGSVRIDNFRITDSFGECSDEETIMKLYQEKNSHAGLWGDGNYNVRVCSPNGEVVDHSSNAVLWLSSETNSHVSVDESEEYNVPVYFGSELSCEVRENSCLGNEVVVLSLFEETNSHVSKGDDADYNWKVCCVSGVPPIGNVGEAYWTDVNFEKISEADLYDTVRLAVEGYSEDDLENFEFEIYETGESAWAWWNPFSWSSEDVLVEGVVGGTTWIANEKGEYYFLVNSSGDIIADSRENDYGILEVKSSQDDDPFKLELLEPECGEDIFVGESLNIKVDASDGDDLIFGNVSINGNLVKEISNGLTEFSHTFSEAGVVPVVVYAENSRGYKIRVFSNVIVVNPAEEDYYVASCIDEPKDFTNLEEKSVPFNASSTRGLLNSSGELTEIDKDDINFNWTFSDKTSHNLRGNDSFAYVFNKTFGKIKQGFNNWARLDVDVVEEIKP